MFSKTIYIIYHWQFLALINKTFKLDVTELFTPSLILHYMCGDNAQGKYSYNA